MTEAFYAAYGGRPEELQPLDPEEAQQIMQKYLSSTTTETHKMAVPCAEDEHDKVFSGMYQACSPPNWWWICKTCGELGKDTAHVVHPKNVREFVKLMVKFRPTEAGWWTRFLDKEDRS